MISTRDIEVVNVYTGQPLNVGARQVFGQDLPIGEAWYRMDLKFSISLTIGTGTGAISEGLLTFIRNILIKNNKGEISTNLDGRSLYRIAHFKAGIPSILSTTAAATGVYEVHIPIFFADERMVRINDSIYDTSRLTSVSIDVQLGTVADLLTTPGTATVTASVDVEVTRVKGLLPDSAKPIGYVNYDRFQILLPNLASRIDLDRGDDISYKRLYVFASVNPNSTIPFTGTPNDVIQRVESIEHESGFIQQRRVHTQIQNDGAIMYGLNALPAGYTVFDFVKDGSLNSALWSWNYSRLAYVLDPVNPLPSNPAISIAYETFRAFK